MNIDYAQMALDSISHTADEFKAAVEDGKAIWSLDTGTFGEDDLIIYDAIDSEESIMAEIEVFVGDYDIFVSDKTNHWTVERLLTTELEIRYPLEEGL